MLLHKNTASIKKSVNTIITLGTFDGLHKGHKKILEAVVEQAKSKGLRSLLVTYEPHPRSVITPELGIPLLTTVEEKARFIAESGIEEMLVVEFTKEFAKQSPEEFIKNYLGEQVGFSKIIVGYDHKFGKGRGGDAETLRKLGNELGFEVEVVPGYTVDGVVVSSTLIRKSLQEGDLQRVNAFLGRWYSELGTVTEGKKRGRTIGFPTANIASYSPLKLLPTCGVYAVFLELEGKKYHGTANIGYRPTFDTDKVLSTEVYIHDFDALIYGKEVSIEFVQKLRGEKEFGSVKELIEQITADVKRSREILQEHG